MTQGSLEDNIEASGLHATSQRHTRTSKCPPEPYTISEREAVREGERVKESFGWVNPLRCGSSSASSHKQQFLSLSLSSPLTPTHKNKAHASGGRAQLEVLELATKTRLGLEFAHVQLGRPAPRGITCPGWRGRSGRA